MNFSIKKYSKIFLDEKEIKKIEDKFIWAFNDFDFSEIIKDNKIEKAKKKLAENKNFIYGEITFNALLDLIESINNIDPEFFIKKDKVFLDIGSGTGKVVIGFYLFFLFKKCIGIELMENLYIKSDLIKDKILNFPSENCFDNKIEFLNADILDYNLTEIDCLFANSTCWTKDFIEKLINKINKEGKEGLMLLNTDQDFFKINKQNSTKEKWKFYKTIKIESNWGYSYLYISRKIKI